MPIQNEDGECEKLFIEISNLPDKRSEGFLLQPYTVLSISRKICNTSCRAFSKLATDMDTGLHCSIYTVGDRNKNILLRPQK